MWVVGPKAGGCSACDRGRMCGLVLRSSQTPWRLRPCVWGEWMRQALGVLTSAFALNVARMWLLREPRAGRVAGWHLVLPCLPWQPVWRTLRPDGEWDKLGCVANLH